MQEIIQKAKDYALSEYSKYDGKFGPEFKLAGTKECAKMANELAEESMNKDALIIVAYLHDIGRRVTDGPEHAAEGVKIVNVFLEENNVDEETKRIALDCVLNHGSSADAKTKEAKLLQFIDKAALLKLNVLKPYFENLMKSMSKEQVIEKAFKSVDKWYNRLWERKSELDEEYKACKEFLANQSQSSHQSNP